MKDGDKGIEKAVELHYAFSFGSNNGSNEDKLLFFNGVFCPLFAIVIATKSLLLLCINLIFLCFVFDEIVSFYYKRFHVKKIQIKSTG